MEQQVLFVCLGNICRSPTAHGVFNRQLTDAGLNQRITADSAGTGAWHVGEPPDERAAAAAARRGYDLSSLRARQVRPDDFQRFDYILAMDKSNLLHLQALCPADYPGHLGLFLDYHPASPILEVPDPYYGGSDGFNEVLDLVEQAGQGLLQAMNGGQ
ncbi:MAG: low molecular weight protein-tyrosine-phosphatase [Halieaceae bacterium]